MVSGTAGVLAAAESLDELHDGLHEISIGPGWAKPEPSLYPEPYKIFKPAQWKWENGKAALDAAGGLISTELAERRNLILYNPIEGNSYSTVRTLIAAYQMILPGEKARSHRHTPNALRLILEGEGAYTTVQGQRIDMKPNDVLLTPNWHWHGHGSDADGPCYWLDCLDVPLVHFLEPMFFEPHPEGFEEDAPVPDDTPLVFPWAEISAALDAATPDPDGRYGRRVPLGKPAMSTTALHMQRLESGQATRRQRTTANQIFCAVEGEGVTVVDGERFEWRRGDVMAVPGWRPFEHQASTGATLFEMSDEPVMKACGWLRTAD